VKLKKLRDFKCLINSNESIYIGQVFASGNGKKVVPHGYGVILFNIRDNENIERYEGEWEYGKRHGLGCCILRKATSIIKKQQKKQKIIAIWEDNAIVKLLYSCFQLNG